MDPDLKSYDHVIVAFSGGKDSLACVLTLLEQGCPPERIELWHHLVDGREGSTLMDWPCTTDYCRKVAAAMGLPLYFSWREGGFEREMCRHESATGKCWFETPLGLMSAGGKGHQQSTRELWPQVSADLKVRWCSPYLKIDVSRRALANQPRFVGARTLFVTGERAQESKGRAKYKQFEPHTTHADNRHIDWWRPVHQWHEEAVWAIIERHRINPHPAYQLGWGRVSCAPCIFGNADQFASLLAVNPAQHAAVAGYEVRWGKTIKRNKSLTVLTDEGTPYSTITPELAALALSETFNALPILPVGEWRLPAGAYGDSCGPT